MKKPLDKKPLPIWILVWITLLLLILVLLFANRGFVDNIGKATGLFPVLDAPPATLVRQAEGKAPTIELPQAPPSMPPPESAPLDPSLAPLLPPSESPIEPPADETTQPAATAQPPAETAAPAAATVKKVTLYFVNIGNEGKIEMFPASREMSLGPAPLSSLIRELIKGPSPDELAKGYLSLIPADSALLSARIQDGTAFLSFNDEFQYNSLGLEGYIAQLRQIIFTATSFAQIKRVQFLIKGQYKDSLGAEGVSIAKPLDRGSF